MSKRALYDDLAAQLAALLEGESDPIANAANTAALIYHGLPDLNWAGFYFAARRRTRPRALSGQAGLRAHSVGPGRVRHGGGARRRR